MSDFKLNRAARYIRQGGIIAYPTEAVYGLGCDPFNAAAVLRLLALKQRAIGKGIILIAADFTQIEPLILPLTADQKQCLETSWPDPTTWLVPVKPTVPVWVTGAHNRIALRITAHPLAKTLCEKVGHAIVSTSANISQQQPARSSLTVRRYFHNQIDFILTGSLGRLGKPTTIKDLLTGAIIR